MPKLSFLLAAALVFSSAAAHADKKTVCTITVNSPDEKETFRSRLPKGEYEFVELVEKGRPDWLRSSCRKGVQCDVLLVSGHFNAGDTFYSDKVDSDEHLNVDELERASCSNSCPGLFSKLKEVYLFGCESLNPDASRYASAYGESGRDRMRRIFANVPVIYGFSSSAPVGPTAAMLLNRYFDAGGGDIGTGRKSARMLGAFARNSMVTTSGVRDTDPEAQQRRQICGFFDERKAAAEKLRFIHALMRRNILDAATSFDRIEKLLAAIDESERQSPAFSAALAEFSADDATRERFLAIARLREPSLRSRMITLAATLGWLAPADERGERLALVNDLLAAPAIGQAEVELVCGFDRGAAKSGDFLQRVKLPAARATSVAHQAALACLGSEDAHGKMLRAIASPDEQDVRIAQVYLRHRPIGDPQELRVVAREVSRMPPSGAQVRAFDTLGRLHIADREILEELARSYAESRSAIVQLAIAEVFIRSDQKAMRRSDLASVIRQYRIKQRGGSDLIDVLLARLQ